MILLLIALGILFMLWSITNTGKPSADYTPEDKERDDLSRYIKEACRIGIMCEHCSAVYDSDELVDYCCPECGRRLI